MANAPSNDVIDKMRHELRILKQLEYTMLLTSIKVEVIMKWLVMKLIWNQF
jgi:hypothetical protein